MASRPPRKILLIFLSLYSFQVSGHEGHDHGAPALAPKGAPGASSNIATASMKGCLSPLWTVLLLLLLHSLLSFQARAHEAHVHETLHPSAPAPALNSDPISPSSPRTSMASAPIKPLSPLWAVLLLLPFLSFQPNTKLCHDHDTRIDADAANRGDHQGTIAPNSPSPCKSSVFWAPMKASRPLAGRILLLLLFLVLSSSPVSAHDHDANGDGQDNLRSRGLIAVKIWCLLILLVSTFAGGVSPYFFRWNENFLLMGTQFAGGVFLGTSLMHFLADANSTFADLTSKTYPFAFMLASVGYLLTMFGDCIIVRVTQAGGRKEARVEVLERGKGGEEHGEEMRLDLHPAFVRTTSLGDTLLLILALCFHSVFEGIAIGVADTKASAWRNLWTISLHKIFAAVAMGIALLRMLPKRPFLMTVVYSLAFAISSPIGVGIGIAIDATTQGPVADWTYAISMGLACGVFIYVAINHLIAKGFKPQEPSYFDTPFFKFFAVLIGVAVIAVVMIWD